jgi:hypothetical protein
VKLHRQADRDRALSEHVETTHFFDEQTGGLYEPAEPPLVEDAAGDEDSDLAG